MTKIQLQIYEGRDPIEELIEADGEVVCGRQDPKKGDPAPIKLYQCDGRNRLVLMPADQKQFSREWFAVFCDEKGQVALRNLHRVHDVKLLDGHRIAAGETEVLGKDITVSLSGTRSVRVAGCLEESADRDSAPKETLNFRVLDSVPLTPGNDVDVDATMTLGQFAQSEGNAVAELIKIALKVVQQSSGSDAFIQAAAQATTEIVGLDRAKIVMCNAAQCMTDSVEVTQPVAKWRIAAEFLAPGIDAENAPPISRTILERVTADHTTQIHDPENQSFEPVHSVQSIHSIVASPILDCRGEVVGVLYGDRWKGHSASGTDCISDLEGALVEVLAGAVAGGIARQEEERLRSNLSGFFSPRVAGLLASRPELLLGQDATVSVLFCDIRGFSTVTEQLGPQKTIEWINDVLSDLSRCVVDRDGVLVDYVGDELMAMWGAPETQADHADRAVKAAIAMLEAIEVLRDRWSDRLPQRFGAGVGISTGAARVGNVGSDLKFKYGVLGNTVNSGARLQAATKQFGVNCLAGEATITGAGVQEQTRRIAKLKVVGIEQQMDVFEVVRTPDENWLQLRTDYESALSDYESQSFGEATRKLGTLIQQHPDDRPCRLLLKRAVTQLDEPDSEFSPVWVLTRK